MKEVKMKKKIRLFITALTVLITFLFINISKIKASTAINSYEEEQGLLRPGELIWNYICESFRDSYY